jgi:superfamily II DNA helicase RecQ
MASTNIFSELAINNAIDSVINRLDRRSKNIHLRHFQRQTIISTINHDTILSAPTGAGKTLIFTLLPFVITELYQFPVCIFVLSPLVSLIKNQMSKIIESLQLPESCAVKLDCSNAVPTQVKEMVLNDRLKLVFCCPESFITESVLDCYHLLDKNVAAIVIDEAQCAAIADDEDFRDVCTHGVRTL